MLDFLVFLILLGACLWAAYFAIAGVWILVLSWSIIRDFAKKQEPK